MSRSYRLELFLWENGARNCSIVGATFWCDFEVLVTPLTDVALDVLEASNLLIRRHDEHFHALAAKDLRRIAGLSISCMVYLPLRCDLLRSWRVP